MIQYKGSLYTSQEIRLLQFMENNLNEKRRLEEDKRQERILLTQSLQSSMLMGMHIVSFIPFLIFVLTSFYFIYFSLIYLFKASGG